MADTQLLQSLMGLNSGVASPQVAAGLPIQQGLDPMSGLQGLPPATMPAATPVPDLSANLNPGRKAKSLEELLFGG